MKTILKTIDPKRDLDYNETFNSEKNIKIRHSLVAEAWLQNFALRLAN